MSSERRSWSREVRRAERLVQGLRSDHRTPALRIATLRRRASGTPVSNMKLFPSASRTTTRGTASTIPLEYRGFTLPCNVASLHTCPPDDPCCLDTCPAFVRREHDHPWTGTQPIEIDRRARRSLPTRRESSDSITSCLLYTSD